MVFPFGVSVGDFISVVKLISEAISTFSDTKRARTDFTQLAATLKSLLNAIEAIAKLSTSTDDAAVIIALNSCKGCINGS